MRLYLTLLFLAAIWGASFLFLRICSPEFGPVPLIFVRTALAACVLLPFLIWSNSARELFEHWKMFLLLGALSTALPFSLFAYTSIHLTAGSTSILNAITPLFGALVALIFLGERLPLWGVIGLVLGFFGVFVLTSLQAESGAAIPILPILSALGATLLYAVSSTLVKMYMSNMTPLLVATASQLYAALILLPATVLLWPSTSPSAFAWGSAVAMAIFSTALALIIFFHLLQTVGVTKTISVTYLIPLFGVLWGYLFLNEALTPSMLLGGALILVGVGLTTGVINGSLLLRFVPGKSH